MGGVLLFGLFQLACAAGFGALGAIPELPPLAGASVHGLGRGLSESDAPRAVGAEYKDQRDRPREVRSGSGGI